LTGLAAQQQCCGSQKKFVALRAVTDPVQSRSQRLSSKPVLTEAATLRFVAADRGIARGDRPVPPYDALLVVSFGGPEGPDDVLPFLENVVRGRNVPRERLLEVAEHYQHFGGVSPLNQQNRDLIAALRPELTAAGITLPIYFGNRNWHPLLADTLRQMRDDGIQHALAFVTSAFSSYSGCRQYRENIEAARSAVGEQAPAVDKLRVFYNHPGYIEPLADLVRAALATIPAERRTTAPLIFTAHSVPLAMAQSSRYVEQLQESSRLVADAVGHSVWQLVYQSRSGPPTQPWLEPDILAHLRGLHAQGIRDVVVSPIGFLSDHMEVLFDLDTEARDLCAELGLTLVRVPTVGTQPKFIRMIVELIQERLSGAQPRAIGKFGPSHDVCPVDCCPAPTRPPARS